MKRNVLFAMLMLGALGDAALAARGAEGRPRAGGTRPREGFRAREQEPFERTTLLSAIASGDEKVVTFDRAGGATHPGDASSRYVIIRNAFGGRRHVLGILTPSGRRQPTSIFDRAALAPREVGAVFRAVLQADTAATGRSVPGWRARVNLPARISVDILHVHGDAGPERAERLAGTPRAMGGFDLYDGATIAVTAAVSPSQIGAGDEELLGKMVLAVAGAAQARGITDGSLEVSRADQRLTVRVRTGGRFRFGTDE